MDAERPLSRAVDVAGRSLTPSFALILSMISNAMGQSSARNRPRESGTVPQARVDTRPIAVRLIEGRDIQFSRLPAGLSQTRVAQFAQDDLGFMWFGTQYGLNRFDGNRFKVFRFDRTRANGVSGAYIYSLFKDRSGSLWVGSEHQVLDRLDPVTERFTHFRIDGGTSAGAPVTVQQVSQDREGMLWLSTGQGLYRLDPVTGSTTRYGHEPDDPSSLSSNDIRSTGEDRAGTFWVANGEGLDAFDRVTGKVTFHIPLRESRELSFHQDRAGTFWITYASDNGLAVFDRRRNRLTRYAFYEPAASRPLQSGVYAMLEDRDGTMWFGTGSAGLVKFDRERQQFISYRNDPNDPKSLAGNGVPALFEDRDGNIWVSLHGAAPNLFSRRRPSFAKLPPPPADAPRLGETLINAIFEDRSRILWLSVAGAVYGVDRKREQYTYYGSHGRRLTADVLTMVEDSSGILWAGTTGQGLSRFDRRTGRLTTYRHNPTDPSSLSHDLIEGLLIDRTRTLWAATWDGLDRFDQATERFMTYKVDWESSRAQFYTDIVEDERGVFWLGSNYSGLHRFDPATGVFTVYPHVRTDPRSLSDNRVNSVYITRSGAIWVGTQNGLDEFHPEAGTFTVYDSRNGLPGNVVSCIREDARGNLWMSTNEGLARFDPLRHSFAKYSVADGLPGPDLTGWGACYKSPSGEMFFGGFSGGIAFYPQEVTEDAHVPVVAFTDFRLSGAPVEIGGRSPLGRSIAYTQAVTLAYEQKVFAVEFSALSYLHPTAIRYRYMLEGLDPKWNEVGSDDRHASYSTLPAGVYTLRVQAATERGAWSQPGASLRIEILPPWWRTWWFRGAIALVALVLLWSAHEALLQTRSDAVREERSRMAREIHDSLLQGFGGIALQLHAASAQLSLPPGQQSVLDRVLALADRTLTQAREAVWDMRLPGLAAADLATECGAAARGILAGGSTEALVVTRGRPRRLSAAYQTECLRIVEEALTNVPKHAEAAHVVVELDYGWRRLRLTIKDDGKGFDLARDGKRPGHWGLLGMRERASRIGARLTIDSAPGSGTVVQVDVPYQLGLLARLRASEPKD